METNLDLFGNPLLTQLVYRKFQKSAVAPMANYSNLPQHKKPIEYTRYLSLKPSSFCEYRQPTFKDISVRAIEGSGLPIDRKHHGLMSNKANKSIQTIIDWMLLSTKEKVTFNPKYSSNYSFKINFVTLSLPSKQMHTDKYLQEKLFSPFLDWVRKTKHAIGLDSLKTSNCKMYFWRSESQANGNIHWHLCTDVFIPYKTIQGKWNHLCSKLGYIDAFEKKFNHRSPNSTDVHSIRKVRNIAKYLSKYCGKNSKGVIILVSKLRLAVDDYKIMHVQNKWNYPLKDCKYYRQIYSRLWGCSENLSKLKKCRTILSSEMEIELIQLRNNYPHRVRNIEFATVYRIDAIELIGLEMLFIRQVLINHYLSIINPTSLY